MKDIYAMILHETLNGKDCGLEKWITIVRVPGGWLYKELDENSNTISVVFVPYSLE